MTDEEIERAAAVAEARRWIGTPYHVCADIHGVGVDCGMLIIRVFCDLGLVPMFDPRPYSSDWMLHRDEDVFLDTARKLFHREWDPRDTPPARGDVVIWKHGRTFSHGGIVTEWPRVVHAYADARLVEEVSIEGSPMMTLGTKPRAMLALSCW